MYSLQKIKSSPLIWKTGHGSDPIWTWRL